MLFKTKHKVRLRLIGNVCFAGIWSFKINCHCDLMVAPDKMLKDPQGDERDINIWTKFYGKSKQGSLLKTTNINGGARWKVPWSPVTRIHEYLGFMNICTKFHGNASSSCWDSGPADQLTPRMTDQPIEWPTLEPCYNQWWVKSSSIYNTSQWTS